MKTVILPHFGAVSVNRALIVIIALAVLLRVSAALYLGDRVEPVSGAYDQVSYDALAQRLLAGHGFSFPVAWYPFTPPDQPTAHWSYLYTLYLAGIYVVFGHHPLAARLIQALASGLHIWLAYRLARRLTPNPSPSGRGVGGEGLATAALTAVYAYFIFFNATLMTQTFYILAVLFALDIALQIREWHIAGHRSPVTGPESQPATCNLQPPIRNWLFLGLALGLGALLRQTLLLFAPILLAWLGWQRSGVRDQGSGGRRRSSFVGGLLVTIAVIILLVAPWTVYNYVTFGDLLLLNSNGGYWFWASNHPSRGVHFDGDYAPAIPEELRHLNEPALDRALYRRGLEFILADPLRFLRLSLSRVNGYFWLLPSAQSSLLSNLGRVLSFTVFLPFMIYGLWLSRRYWWAYLPLYLYIAFDTVLHLISWAAPRYRLPSDALLLVFAGMAVADVAGRAGRGGEQG